MNRAAFTKKLSAIYDRLPAQDQHALLAFAEFLAARAPAASAVPAAPLAIPRPPQESIIAAIKRLSQTYPMLDKAKILNETSALMSQHLVGGLALDAAIDDLEALFQRHYQALKEVKAASEAFPLTPVHPLQVET